MFTHAARLAGLFFVLCVAPFASAQQKPQAIPPFSTSNWRLVNTQAVEINAVKDWGGEPAVEREYGVKSLERRTYQSGGKAAEALVEEAADTTAAYGLLTFYRTPEFTPEPGVEFAARGPQATLLARGRCFIRVPRPGTGSLLSESEFRDLLASLSGLKPATNPLANLPATMPLDGLVAGSDKYILGPEAARRTLASFPIDLIGFSQGAEVQAATYKSGKDRATVMSISYPTPQIARIRFGAIEKFLSVNHDRGHGSLYGKRGGTFVFMVLDASTPAAASRTLEKFDVAQSVSWDRKYPGNDNIWVQVAKLILGNMVLVGILVGLAVLGGGMIFISKRLAGKWFPDSVWGNPDGERIIRLNLS